MIDLEELIRNRQDVLRGRPRDWGFGDRRRNADWFGVGVLIGVLLTLLASFALVLWAL